MSRPAGPIDELTKRQIIAIVEGLATIGCTTVALPFDKFFTTLQTSLDEKPKKGEEKGLGLFDGELFTGNLTEDKRREKEAELLAKTSATLANLSVESLANAELIRFFLEECKRKKISCYITSNSQFSYVIEQFLAKMGITFSDPRRGDNSKALIKGIYGSEGLNSDVESLKEISLRESLRLGTSAIPRILKVDLDGRNFDYASEPILAGKASFIQSPALAATLSSMQGTVSRGVRKDAGFNSAVLPKLQGNIREIVVNEKEEIKKKQSAELKTVLQNIKQRNQNEYPNHTIIANETVQTSGLVPPNQAQSKSVVEIACQEEDAKEILTFICQKQKDEFRVGQEMRQVTQELAQEKISEIKQTIENYQNNFQRINGSQPRKAEIVKTLIKKRFFHIFVDAGSIDQQHTDFVKTYFLEAAIIISPKIYANFLNNLVEKIKDDEQNRVDRNDPVYKARREMLEMAFEVSERYVQKESNERRIVDKELSDARDNARRIFVARVAPERPAPPVVVLAAAPAPQVAPIVAAELTQEQKIIEAINGLKAHLVKFQDILNNNKKYKTEKSKAEALLAEYKSLEEAFNSSQQNLSELRIVLGLQKIGVSWGGAFEELHEKLAEIKTYIALCQANRSQKDSSSKLIGNLNQLLSNPQEANEIEHLIGWINSEKISGLREAIKGLPELRRKQTQEIEQFVVAAFGELALIFEKLQKGELVDRKAAFTGFMVTHQLSQTSQEAQRQLAKLANLEDNAAVKNLMDGLIKERAKQMAQGYKLTGFEEIYRAGFDLYQSFELSKTQEGLTADEWKKAADAEYVKTIGDTTIFVRLMKNVFNDLNTLDNSVAAASGQIAWFISPVNTDVQERVKTVILDRMIHAQRSGGTQETLRQLAKTIILEDLQTKLRSSKFKYSDSQVREAPNYVERLLEKARLTGLIINEDPANQGQPYDRLAEERVIEDANELVEAQEIEQLRARYIEIQRLIAEAEQQEKDRAERERILIAQRTFTSLNEHAIHYYAASGTTAKSYVYEQNIQGTNYIYNEAVFAQSVRDYIVDSEVRMKEILAASLHPTEINPQYYIERDNNPHNPVVPIDEANVFKKLSIIDHLVLIGLPKDEEVSKAAREIFSFIKTELVRDGITDEQKADYLRILIPAVPAQGDAYQPNLIDKVLQGIVDQIAEANTGNFEARERIADQLRMVQYLFDNFQIEYIDRYGDKYKNFDLFIDAMQERLAAALPTDDINQVLAIGNLSLNDFARSHVAGTPIAISADVLIDLKIQDAGRDIKKRNAAILEIINEQLEKIPQDENVIMGILARELSPKEGNIFRAVICKKAEIDPRLLELVSRQKDAFRKILITDLYNKENSLNALIAGISEDITGYQAIEPQRIKRRFRSDLVQYTPVEIEAREFYSQDILKRLEFLAEALEPFKEEEKIKEIFENVKYSLSKFKSAKKDEAELDKAIASINISKIALKAAEILGDILKQPETPQQLYTKRWDALQTFSNNFLKITRESKNALLDNVKYFFDFAMLPQTGKTIPQVRREEFEKIWTLNPMSPSMVLRAMVEAYKSSRDNLFLKELSDYIREKVGRNEDVSQENRLIGMDLDSPEGMNGSLVSLILNEIYESAEKASKDSDNKKILENDLKFLLKMLEIYREINNYQENPSHPYNFLESWVNASLAAVSREGQVKFLLDKDSPNNPLKIKEALTRYCSAKERAARDEYYDLTKDVEDWELEEEEAKTIADGLKLLQRNHPDSAFAKFVQIPLRKDYYNAAQKITEQSWQDADEETQKENIFNQIKRNFVERTLMENPEECIAFSGTPLGMSEIDRITQNDRIIEMFEIAAQKYGHEAGKLEEFLHLGYQTDVPVTNKNILYILAETGVYDEDSSLIKLLTNPRNRELVAQSLMRQGKSDPIMESLLALKNDLEQGRDLNDPNVKERFLFVAIFAEITEEHDLKNWAGNIVNTRVTPFAQALEARIAKHDEQAKVDAVSKVKIENLQEGFQRLIPKFNANQSRDSLNEAVQLWSDVKRYIARKDGAEKTQALIDIDKMFKAKNAAPQYGLLNLFAMVGYHYSRDSIKSDDELLIFISENLTEILLDPAENKNPAFIYAARTASSLISQFKAIANFEGDAKSANRLLSILQDNLAAINYLMTVYETKQTFRDSGNLAPIKAWVQAALAATEKVKADLSASNLTDQKIKSAITLTQFPDETSLRIALGHIEQNGLEAVNGAGVAQAPAQANAVADALARLAQPKQQISPQEKDKNDLLRKIRSHKEFDTEKGQKEYLAKIRAYITKYQPDIDFEAILKKTKTTDNKTSAILHCLIESGFDEGRVGYGEEGDVLILNKLKEYLDDNFPGADLESNEKMNNLIGMELVQPDSLARGILLKISSLVSAKPFQDALADKTLLVSTSLDKTLKAVENRLKLLQKFIAIYKKRDPSLTDEGKNYKIISDWVEKTLPKIASVPLSGQERLEGLRKFFKEFTALPSLGNNAEDSVFAMSKIVAPGRFMLSETQQAHVATADQIKRGAQKKALIAFTDVAVAQAKEKEINQKFEAIGVLLASYNKSKRHKSKYATQIFEKIKEINEIFVNTNFSQRELRYPGMGMWISGNFKAALKINKKKIEAALKDGTFQEGYENILSPRGAQVEAAAALAAPAVREPVVEPAPDQGMEMQDFNQQTPRDEKEYDDWDDEWEQEEEQQPQLPQPQQPQPQPQQGAIDMGDLLTAAEEDEYQPVVEKQNILQEIKTCLATINSSVIGFATGKKTASHFEKIKDNLKEIKRLAKQGLQEDNQNEENYLTISSWVETYYKNQLSANPDPEKIKIALKKVTKKNQGQGLPNPTKKDPNIKNQPYRIAFPSEMSSNELLEELNKKLQPIANLYERAQLDWGNVEAEEGAFYGQEEPQAAQPLARPQSAAFNLNAAAARQNRIFGLEEESDTDEELEIATQQNRATASNDTTSLHSVNLDEPELKLIKTHLEKINSHVNELSKKLFRNNTNAIAAEIANEIAQIKALIPTDPKEMYKNKIWGEISQWVNSFSKENKNKVDINLIKTALNKVTDKTRGLPNLTASFTSVELLRNVTAVVPTAGQVSSGANLTENAAALAAAAAAAAQATAVPVRAETPPAPPPPEPEVVQPALLPPKIPFSSEDERETAEKVTRHLLELGIHGVYTDNDGTAMKYHTFHSMKFQNGTVNEEFVSQFSNRAPNRSGETFTGNQTQAREKFANAAMLHSIFSTLSSHGVKTGVISKGCETVVKSIWQTADIFDCLNDDIMPREKVLAPPYVVVDRDKESKCLVLVEKMQKIAQEKGIPIDEVKLLVLDDETNQFDKLRREFPQLLKNIIIVGGKSDTINPDPQFPAWEVDHKADGPTGNSQDVGLNLQAWKNVDQILVAEIAKRQAIQPAPPSPSTARRTAMQLQSGATVVNGQVPGGNEAEV